MGHAYNAHAYAAEEVLLPSALNDNIAIAGAQVNTRLIAGGAHITWMRGREGKVV